MKVFTIKVEIKHMQIGLKVTAYDLNQIIAFNPPCINIVDKYSGIKILIPMDQVKTLMVDEVNE